MVFSFPIPVQLSSASVTPGPGKTATMAGPPGISADGRTVTLNLASVSDAQTVSILLTGVSNGTSSNDVSIQLRILFGDVTGNGTVNSTDVAQVRSSAGAPVSAANFRTDVTVNGSINGSDVSAVKAVSGNGVSNGSDPYTEKTGRN